MPPSAHRKRRASAATATSKRRRRVSSSSSAAADASESSDVSSWGSLLPRDLLCLIGWRALAGDLRDYVRLRAVCREWRSATVCPRGRGLHDPRFRPRRWMMLPEGHGLHPGHYKLGGYIRFINLSTGAIVRVRLLLFSNHCVLDSVDGIDLSLLVHIVKKDHKTPFRPVQIGFHFRYVGLKGLLTS